jgi:hypothetical protein
MQQNKLAKALYSRLTLTLFPGSFVLLDSPKDLATLVVFLVCEA